MKRQQEERHVADEDKDTFCWGKRFEVPTVIAFIFSVKRALTVLVMISSWYAGWEFGKKCICLSFTSLSYKSWIFFFCLIFDFNFWRILYTQNIKYIAVLCMCCVVIHGVSPVHLTLSLNRSQYHVFKWDRSL